jgi:transposase
MQFALNWSLNYLGLFFNAICMGVREFREASDCDWEVVRSFLPPLSRVGRPRADDRMVLNGILYVLTSGCRWCKYGSYKTAWRRWVYGRVYSRH